MDNSMFQIWVTVPGEEEFEADEAEIWDQDGDNEADAYASRCLNAFWPE